MLRCFVVAAALLVFGANGLVLHRKGVQQRCAPLSAGFGAAATKKKKDFVSSGKKDLEKQWESFVALQRKGSRLLSCESVWARTDDADPWLRVGAVVTSGDAVSNAEAVNVQKKLIGWTAEALHPTLNGRKTLAYGLGPYIDDDGDDGDLITRIAAAADKVKPVDKGKGEVVAKDVGFKPVRSPLDEHTTSLAGALLNKSKSKGSAKFKGAAGGDGGSDGGAESRSTKFLGV